VRVRTCNNNTSWHTSQSEVHGIENFLVAKGRFRPQQIFRFATKLRVGADQTSMEVARQRQTVLARSSEAAHPIRKQPREGLLFSPGRVEPRERMRLLPLEFERRRGVHLRRLRSSCAIFAASSSSTAATATAATIVDVRHRHRQFGGDCSG
jgi:hypothetical protein